MLQGYRTYISIAMSAVTKLLALHGIETPSGESLTEAIILLSVFFDASAVFFNKIGRDKLKFEVDTLKEDNRAIQAIQTDSH